MGTFTQSFIPSISSSNALILGPIDARRDIHVRNAPPGPGVAPANESGKELARAR
jgi:hypothetical protein